MDSIDDIMSQSLISTLDVQYEGYKQYVHILQQLENMPPIEFTYYDDLNVSRTLRVHPLTLVPLTMLHIKHATFDYSVMVDELASSVSEEAPSLVDSGNLQKAKQICQCSEYVLTGGRYVGKPTKERNYVQVGVFNFVSALIRTSSAITKSPSRILNVKYIEHILQDRVASTLQAYNGLPFVYLDNTFYFPRVVSWVPRASESPQPSFLVFKGIELKAVKALPSSQTIGFFPDTSAVLKQYSKEVLARSLRYTFYNNGSCTTAGGEKLVPSSKVEAKDIFTQQFKSGTYGNLVCLIGVRFATLFEEMKSMSGLTVKSEKKSTSNLRISVKMGQAGISQGVVDLLKAKNNISLK